ncbi:hypothetical protein FC75_GL001924 [Lacticaseibacillus camelliae DSM 22697 = JCM 13995]|uniref:F5/8 type C domain-containing protein n=1 Tax=Lacticaseibacillus camelliae DSM 22697 = JCM 13995 TaxID=1423730 RepID=A0A0R2F9M6_9LACO|nr:hypothetical protein FC75_GL001924 [Lacticaseibacillus camelliae DSM 22697 = JCM 13995]
MGLWLLGVAAAAGTLLGIATQPVYAADTAPISTSVELNIVKKDGFVHPGISVDPEQLQQTRAALSKGAQPWTTYYQGMLASPYASLDFQASNLKEGTFDTPLDNTFTSNKQEPRLSADGFRAYTQAVLYYLTGNRQYRYNALRLVRIWENMNPAGYKYYADAHIHAPIPFYYMVSAAELLKYTSVVGANVYTDAAGNNVDLRWSTQDNDQLVKNLVDPLTATLLIKIKDQYFNQHLYALTGAMAGAIFKDDREAYAADVEQTFVNATSARPNINGALGNLFHVIAADDPRNPTGQSFVQHLEMGRDENHAKDDVLCLAGLARIINNQGIKVDKTTGVPSTAESAVDPYQFGDQRLLKGVEQFYKYNLGETVPWIQVSQPGDAAHPAIESDGVQNIIDYGGAVSTDGRGRLNKFFSLSEVYDYYRYQENMSASELAQIAPALTAEATHLNAPEYYTGTTKMNYWGAYSDSKITEVGAEYWLSIPAGKAADAATFPSTGSASKDVSFAQFGTVLDADHATKTKDGLQVTAVKDQSSIKETEYDKLYPKDTKTVRGGSQIALAGLEKPTDGAFALKLKTTGVAKLLVSRDNQPDQVYQTLTLPNTHNQWLTVAYPTLNGNANIDFFAVVADQPKVTVTFAAGSYTDKAALPQIGETAKDAVVFLGQTLNLDLTATNATSLTLVDGPKGMTLSATGKLTWQPTSTGTYPVTVEATNGQRTVTKTFTVTSEKNRIQAYNQATTELQKAPYTTASMAAINAAAAKVQALVKTGTDAQFQAALSDYTAAIAAGELLNPTLKDGSLAYGAYPDLAAANLLDKTTHAIDPKQTFSAAKLTDDNQSTIGGDWHTAAVLDFGKDYTVTLQSVMYLARTGFPNRAQGTNLYGSNDGTTWTKLTTAENQLSNQPQTIQIDPKQAQIAYRYIKIQVDDPGTPTDPAYPGIADYGELHLFGTRAEVAPNPAGKVRPTLLTDPTDQPAKDHSQGQSEVPTKGHQGQPGGPDTTFDQGRIPANGGAGAAAPQQPAQAAAKATAAKPAAASKPQTGAHQQAQAPTHKAKLAQLGERVAKNLSWIGLLILVSGGAAVAYRRRHAN